MTLRIWFQPDKNEENLFRLTCASATAWTFTAVSTQAAYNAIIIAQTASADLKENNWSHANRSLVSFFFVGLLRTMLCKSDNAFRSDRQNSTTWQNIHTYLPLSRPKAHLGVHFSSSFAVFHKLNNSKQKNVPASSKLWVPCFHGKRKTRQFLTLWIVCVDHKRLTSKVTATLARCFKPFIPKFKINFLITISHTFSKTVLEITFNSYRENHQRCIGRYHVSLFNVWSFENKVSSGEGGYKNATCLHIDTMRWFDFWLVEMSSNPLLWSVGRLFSRWRPEA